MNILVISGGISSERKISLISGKEVKKGLEEIGHKVKFYDLKNGYGPIKKMSAGFELVFPVIHGEEGEGGKLNQFLKELKIPYVGGDPNGLKKGWYKIPFKRWCNKNNVDTSEWKEIKSERDLQKFGFPSVLKSSNGGSSREVVILNAVGDLKKKETQKLLKSKDKLFAEKFLKGVEITVAVLGSEALPVLEIVPPENSWFDYKNKYSGETKEIPFAPSVDKKIQEMAQKVALKIHKEFKLGQFSRTDFIVTRQEDSEGKFTVSNGKPFILEVNTIPGLTPNSLFPKAALSKGLKFPQLLDKIVRLVLNENVSQTK